MSLLAIIAVTGGLVFLLKGQFGQIYKTWMIDILETSCYLNIILLSAATLFLFESKRDQTTVTFISVFITFVLSFIVIVHHTYREVWLKLIRSRISCRNNDSHRRGGEVRGILDIYNNEIGAQPEAICTFSEIEAPRRTSECLEAVNNTDQDHSHYCDSDECAPLLMNNEGYA